LNDYIANIEHFPIPIDHDLYAQNSAFERGRDVIDDMTDELYAQGIEISNYNVESGPGQHEISLHHSDPLTSADRLIYARETIKAVAINHGLIVSFVPKLFEDSTGSGCHIHLSLLSKGKNILGSKKEAWNLSKNGQHFIAGILNHLPALMSMTTPTPNSFRRIKPQFWSGAYRIWGIDNKEAAVRVLHNPYGDGPPRKGSNSRPLTSLQIPISHSPGFLHPAKTELLTNQFFRTQSRKTLQDILRLR